MGCIIWSITTSLSREKKSGEVGSIMIFSLVVLKTKLTKFVLDFCAILASYRVIYPKCMPLLTNFQGIFLAALVVAYAFSDNLE